MRRNKINIILNILLGLALIIFCTYTLVGTIVEEDKDLVICLGISFSLGLKEFINLIISKTITFIK